MDQIMLNSQNLQNENLSDREFVRIKRRNIMANSGHQNNNLQNIFDEQNDDGSDDSDVNDERVLASFDVQYQ